MTKLLVTALALSMPLSSVQAAASSTTSRSVYGPERALPDPVETRAESTTQTPAAPRTATKRGRAGTWLVLGGLALIAGVMVAASNKGKSGSTGSGCDLHFC